jgi:hypothetical protein
MSRNIRYVNSGKSSNRGARELALSMPNGPLPADPAARALVDTLVKLDGAHQARALREAMNYLGVRLLPSSQLASGVVATHGSRRR